MNLQKIADLLTLKDAIEVLKIVYERDDIKTTLTK